MVGERRPLDWAWVLGLPFMLAGLAAAGGAIVWAPSGLWIETSTFAIAAIGLGSLGWFTFRTSYRNNQVTLQRNRRRETFPDEPWRWRPDWDARRLESVSRMFGTTVLELDTVPARIGSELRGTIVTAFTDLPPGGLAVKLSAAHVYVTGAGQRRRVHTEVIWEANRIVVVERAQGGLRAQVRFDIPHDASPTDDNHPNNEITWRLSATGEPGGRSFHAVFDVPVF